MKLSTLNSISELDFESTLLYINNKYCPYSYSHQWERQTISRKALVDLWIQSPAKKNPKILMMTHGTGWCIWLPDFLRNETKNMLPDCFKLATHPRRFCDWWALQLRNILWELVFDMTEYEKLDTSLNSPLCIWTTYP